MGHTQSKYILSNKKICLVCASVLFPLNTILNEIKHDINMLKILCLKVFEPFNIFVYLQYLSS